MALFKIVLALSILYIVEAQRPFYAGLRPIGFSSESGTREDILANKFGEDTDKPINARGDGSLVNRLNRLPVDQQPFWYLNWRQYEALNKRPQTYPQRPNQFARFRR